MPVRFKFAALVLFAALLLSVFCFPITADAGLGKGSSRSAVPSLSAKSAILIEAASGRILYAKNATERLPMASTTKIMTALVALESGSPDRIVRIPAEAVGIEGSSIYLFEGEELTLEQLLYALLLSSANDAAVAIAIEIAGSVERFAGLMNQKATELGLTDTHFVNPNGLDDPAHYTTAAELAIITRAALRNPLFCKIVSTKKITIPQGSEPDRRLLVNHNKLLNRYAGAIGVKTGYTKRSGRSLVSAAERNGVTLIAVTINAPNDWNDHTALLDYGFSLCSRVALAEPGNQSYPLPVVGGVTDTVTASNTDGLSVVLPADHGEIRTVIELPRFVYAGIQKGEKLGQIVFWCDTDGDGAEERIGELPLYALHTAEKQPKKGFWNRLLRFFGKK